MLITGKGQAIDPFFKEWGKKNGGEQIHLQCNNRGCNGGLLDIVLHPIMPIMDGYNISAQLPKKVKIRWKITAIKEQIKITNSLTDTTITIQKAHSNTKVEETTLESPDCL